jgi:DNA-binding CsgD family transcriptional regulator
MKDGRTSANPTLSSREKQLLRRLARNKSNDEIAVEIGGRTDQISLQRQRLIERLQIRSEEHLAALARGLALWGSNEHRGK